MERSLQRIKSAVSRATGIPETDIDSRCKNAETAEARALYAWFCRKRTDATLSTVGRTEGGRSHATVLAQCRLIDDMLFVKDKRTKRLIKAIEKIMSDKKQTLEIEPSSGGFNLGESFVFAGFRCPACNGRGWYEEYDGRDRYQHDCPRCEGTGHLKADVKIEWGPEK